MPKLIVCCGRSTEIHYLDHNEQGEIVGHHTTPLHTHAPTVVTMDVDPIMSPDVLGDIRQDPGTGTLPSNHFDNVHFEFMPAWVFGTLNECLDAFRTCHRVMQVEGWLFVNTGANLNPGGDIQNALIQLGFRYLQINEGADGNRFLACQK